MNVENLKTFITLVSVGSYTKAAQKMLVVQSTISKRVKELEAETGKELIIRDKKNIRLTAAGKVFFRYAEEIVALEEKCKQETAQIEMQTGRLNIGSVQSLFECHVTDCVAEFCQKYPGVFVNVRTESSQYLLNHLYDSTIDLCFSYRKFAERNYRCDPFITDEMILVTGPGNPLYENGITDAEIKKLPLIHENLTCVSDKEWFQHIFEENTNPLMYIEVGNKIIPFLQRGIGYGFVVKSFVKDLLERGELFEIPLLERETPLLQSYVVYKMTSEPLKDAFLEHIAGYLLWQPYDGYAKQREQQFELL